MKSSFEIQEALDNLEQDKVQARYFGMNFAQGIKEALRWVMGELDSEDDKEFFMLVFHEKK